jgi:hypothetical protein
LLWTNALAYFAIASVTEKKSFLTLATKANVLKPFLFVADKEVK